MSVLDARGLSCPEPVVMVKKAMASEENARCMTVIVDNVASKENVTRFAEHQGYSVSITEADGEYTLELRK